MQSPLYYAYGSNMLTLRIQQRLGKVEKVANHRLENFEMGFRDGVGMLVSREGAYTEGVLYRVTQQQIGNLNWYEGFPNVYDMWFDVLPDGRIFYLYNKKIREANDVRPNLFYLNLLIDGALENSFNETYRKLVQFKNKHYNLKKGSKHKLLDIP